MTKIALTLLALVFFFPAFSQSGRDVTITLAVDSDGINKKNVVSSVVIADETAGNSSGSNDADTHLIDVYGDFKVTWVAKTNNAAHTVKISKIRKKFFGGKTNILIKKKSKDTDDDGEVFALVQSYEDSRPEKTELYWIKFTVKKGPNQKAVTYKLDPKIRIKPK